MEPEKENQWNSTVFLQPAVFRILGSNAAGTVRLQRGVRLGGAGQLDHLLGFARPVGRGDGYGRTPVGIQVPCKHYDERRPHF